MLLEFYGPRYALFKGENKPLNLEQILAEHPDRREKVLAHLKDTSVDHLLLPPPTTTSLPPQLLQPQPPPPPQPQPPLPPQSTSLFSSSAQLGS
jgi:hypothetical protein